MSSNQNVTVALVGHCGPDSWMLQSTVQRVFTGAVVEKINSLSDLEAKLDKLDLLLVNRVLDGNFGTDNGVDLIGNLKQRSDIVVPATMLISNFEDAQMEAGKVGAVPGFGKSAVNSDQAAQRLQAAINITKI